MFNWALSGIWLCNNKKEMLGSKWRGSLLLLSYHRVYKTTADVGKDLAHDQITSASTFGREMECLSVFSF